jgi:hypothetical protein
MGRTANIMKDYQSIYMMVKPKKGKGKKGKGACRYVVRHMDYEELVAKRHEIRNILFHVVNNHKTWGRDWYDNGVACNFFAKAIHQLEAIPQTDIVSTTIRLIGELDVVCALIKANENNIVPSKASR